MRNTTNGAQSVRRAIALLKAFDRDTPELGVTQLAARVGLHKATVHRLAATLVAERFLRQDPVTGRYALGSELYRIAQLFLEQDPLLREGREVLLSLRNACGHTVSLGVLDGEAVLFLLVLEGTLPVRINVAAPGERAPLWSTATGKVLLASLPPAERAAHLPADPLPSLTPRTLTSRAAVLAEVEEVARQGLGWSREEHTLGVISLAAPARIGRETVALAVSCPTNLVGPGDLAVLGEQVRAAACALAARFGNESELCPGEEQRA
ncbi:MAG: IclR family transcriptional regulator [Chloroflexi bacterium]|jgi:DNA-binding IclR family transcriptional regulator|nr:IclR family transcriptional regulator [Chloroflexota bacterium]